MVAPASAEGQLVRRSIRYCFDESRLDKLSQTPEVSQLSTIAAGFLAARGWPKMISLHGVTEPLSPIAEALHPSKGFAVTQTDIELLRSLLFYALRTEGTMEDRIAYEVQAGAAFTEVDGVKTLDLIACDLLVPSGRPCDATAEVHYLSRTLRPSGIEPPEDHPDNLRPEKILDRLVGAATLMATRSDLIWQSWPSEMVVS